MAIELKPILLDGTETIITTEGDYQLTDPTPNLLYNKTITIDGAFIGKGSVINFYLPNSSVFFYGTSGKILIQTTTDLSGANVSLIVPDGKTALVPDRLNGEIGGVLSGIGSDGVWVLAQLLAPTRWSAIRI